jgi:Ca2+-transporting ATPase
VTIARPDSASHIPVEEDHSVQHADAVAHAIGVDVARGLNVAEAARRLAEHGPNQLRTVEARPVWRRILAQFQDPLVYLLIGAVVIALAGPSMPW